MMQPQRNRLLRMYVYIPHKLNDYTGLLRRRIKGTCPFLVGLRAHAVLEAEHHHGGANLLFFGGTYIMGHK